MGKRPPREDWAPRIVAMSIAVGLNVAFALWLLDSEVLAPIEQISDEPALPIVWITDAPPKPQLLKSRQLAPTVQRPRSVVTPARPHVVVSEPSKPTVQSEPRTLDLSLPAEISNPSIEFGRTQNPALSHWPEKEPALRVRIEDRSLGGRLKSMTKASICAELRHAAERARASGGGSGLDLIDRALLDHDCR